MRGKGQSGGKIVNFFTAVPGKGSKTRRVPIMKNTAALVEAYIFENRLDLAHKASYPLFMNKQHNRLTKEGVAYVINKYAVMAHGISDKVPEKVKCHMLRHSKAVHLLQAGVNLIYIRDFLGHSDIKTIEIYARADTELKRKALENAYPGLPFPQRHDAEAVSLPGMAGNRRNPGFANLRFLVVYFPVSGLCHIFEGQRRGRLDDRAGHGRLRRKCGRSCESSCCSQRFAGYHKRQLGGEYGKHRESAHNLPPLRTERLPVMMCMPVQGQFQAFWRHSSPVS